MSTQLDNISQILAKSAAPVEPDTELPPLLESEPVGEELKEKEYDDSNTDSLEEPEGTENTDGTNGDDDTGDDSGDSLNSINDFAKELDIPISDMYELEVNFSSGTESATLSTIKDFYEANQDITGLRKNITQQQEDLTTERDLVKAEPAISAEAVQARASMLSLEQQYTAIDWEGLRQRNPGEYAAAQADFRAAYDEANNRINTVTGKVTEHEETARQIEQQKLLTAIPELADKEYREEAANKMIDFAEGYGFTQAEIGAITDSRLLRLLIEASGKSLAAKTGKEKLQNKQAPSGQKPTARQPSQSSRKASLARLTKKAKESNNKQDKVNAISALLGNK